MGTLAWSAYITHIYTLIYSGKHVNVSTFASTEDTAKLPLVAVELKASKKDDPVTESEDDNDEEENGSDGSEMEDNSSEHSHDVKSTSNAGWANVMQKILGTTKPKRKKTIVLAKAKKLCDIKEKEKNVSFEIDGIKQEIKTELEGTSPTSQPTIQAKPKRRDTSLGIRIKPSVLDQERERILQKIATK